MDWKRRCELIPDGCSTKSKMPCRYVEGVYPPEVDNGQGAYIGPELQWIDYTMGLGAVLLGHAHAGLRRRLLEQYDCGTIYGWPSHLEAQLAAQLVDLVPSAEMVRFTNTGTEACLAAIKIARAYTGRERLACCGYHGWAPWYSAQSHDTGGCTVDEKGQIHSFSYNNALELENLAGQGPPLAAVIMEPYVFTAPEAGFLESVREFCTRHGSVLIFDEIVTGFRTPGGTAQRHFDVVPDLTCLGKAMCNGIVPISVVCGKRDLMLTLTKDCFVSGTFAANPLACALALAVLDYLDQAGVIAHIWYYGAKLIAGFEQMVAARNLEGVGIRGYPCRTFFDFPTEVHRSLFWQECLKNGVAFGYAQFISHAHQEMELAATLRAMKQGLDALVVHGEDPAAALEGRPAQATMRLVTAPPPAVFAPLPAPGVAQGKFQCLFNPGCPGFDEPHYPKQGRYARTPHCPNCRSRHIMVRRSP